MRVVRQIVSATLLSLGLSSSITAAENEPSQASLTQVVQTLCAACHNEHLLTGGLSLRNYDVARAAELAPTTEKMIVKLRAGMMPPPGIGRPSESVMEALVTTPVSYTHLTLPTICSV